MPGDKKEIPVGDDLDTSTAKEIGEANDEVPVPVPDRGEQGDLGVEEIPPLEDRDIDDEEIKDAKRSRQEKTKQSKVFR